MSETSVSKSGTSPLNGEIDSIVEELIRKYHVPGLSIAVVDNGKIHSKGYGFANLPSTPATADTLYWAGSTTKAFIAAATGRLMEDPKYKKSLKWSTPLKEVLKDDFVLQDEQATNHASIEDALSHRSGLPRHDTAYGWTGSAQVSVVKTMRGMPFTEQFRTTWQYCNTMYAAVGAFLEKLTGKPNGTMLKEIFWDPLGMKSTFFDLGSAAEHASRQPENNLARGYFWVDQKYRRDASGGTFIPEAYINLDCLAAAGTNISSVNDYALWIKAFLSAAAAAPSPNLYPDHKPKSSATSDSNQVVSPELFTHLTTPRIAIARSWPFPDSPSLGPVLNPDLYALGWIISPRVFPGELVVHHSGGLTGFGAQVFMLPEHGFGIVTFGNSAMTSNVVGELVGYELMSRKLELSAQKKTEVMERKNRFLDKVLGVMGLKDEETEEVKDADSSKEHKEEKEAGKKDPSKHEFINDILSQNAAVPDTFDAKRFEGEYHNPAYGTHIFKLVDDAYVEGMHIIRKPKAKSGKDVVTAVVPDLQPPNTTATAAPTTATATDSTPEKHPILYVAPKGKRVWHSRLLLRHQSSSHSETHLFSLEPLSQHGLSPSSNPDPIPLPADLPAARDQRQEEMTMIQGGDAVSAGAAFVFDEDQGKAKVGLLIVSEMDDAAVRDGRKWEEGMIWFERVE